MNDHQTVLQGKEAAQILDSEVYKLAFSRLKDQIVNQWKECPMRDAEGQKIYLLMSKVADKFESEMHGLISAGTFAQNRIDIEKLREEPPKRTLRGLLKVA